MKRSLAALAALSLATATATTAVSSQAATRRTGPDERAAAVAQARSNAAAHASATGLAKGQGLRVRDTVLDPDGSSHVRFERTYGGLEVVGGDLVIHQDKAGGWASMSGKELRPLHLATSPSVSAPSAAAIAAKQVGFHVASSAPEVVVLAADRAPTLSYRVDVTGRASNGEPRGEYVFVDATSGSVLDRWPSVVNEVGSGHGLYSGTVALDTTRNTSGTFDLVDPLRGGNATYNGPATSAPLFTDDDNDWGSGSNADAQSAAVDAHYGIAKTWDFFETTFGRNGIADDGVGARSYVHDGAYVNASWSDACFCMRYGDGDGTTYQPLVELDISGHEMTHGVTSRTAGLRYKGESGGLNEATSDIFGTMVEQYADNANDVPDYVIGEEIFTSYDPATNFIRRMDKPSADGGSADCYTSRTKLLDVHYSSGVANHFFYLLSEGSGEKTLDGIAHASPTCNGKEVTGITSAKAAAIWYRALTVYMTSGTSYPEARTATAMAARDLYGATEVAAVDAAWDAVNVAASTKTKPGR